MQPENVYSRMSVTRCTAAAIAGLFIGVVAGCERPIENSAKLLGTYVLEGVRASDTIWVLPGQSYVHVFRSNQGTIVKDSSTWAFRQLDGPRIAFQEFRQGVADSGDRRNSKVTDETQPATEWFALVERDLSGRLRLPVDPDLGWAYVRKHK